MVGVTVENSFLGTDRKRRYIALKNKSEDGSIAK